MKDLPISFFIRFHKDERGFKHAKLIGKSENGTEYEIMYDDPTFDDLMDLTIVIRPKEKKEKYP